MDLDFLLKAISEDSVIRISVRLATVAQDGLVFPPSYAGEKRGDVHLSFRKAWIDGGERDIVVLDSAQSQSNRVEYAILDAIEREGFDYPDMRIEFPRPDNEPTYSVLQLSHRVYDATLRASILGGKLFPESAIGKAVYAARPATATALFKHAPITPVLGGWDSHSGGGPLAAKFPRLLTSEIVGLDAQRVEISATKVDPMDIRKGVAELVKSDNPARRFELKTPEPKGKDKAGDGRSKEKPGVPSDYGFGSVPATAAPRAAVISGAIQTSSISLSGLRQLRFPPNVGEPDPDRDAAGRAVLAALGLYGLLRQNASGYRLRSRCELIPIAAARLEVIGRTLEDVRSLDLDTDGAFKLLAEARALAKKHDLDWRKGLLKLTADERLAELVRRSREAASGGNGDEE